jgi:hypothetical protein
MGKQYGLMSNHPDFDQYGYHVIQELGRNREAGRITYLAKALNPDQKDTSTYNYATYY